LLARIKKESYHFLVRSSTFVISCHSVLTPCTGYLAIHVLGLSVGTIILAPTPSFFSRRRKALFDKNGKRSNAVLDATAPRQNDKTAVELCAYSAIWWFLLGLTKVGRIGGSWGIQGGISRRMVCPCMSDASRCSGLLVFQVNLPYILWTTAYNTSFLFLYLLLDMWVFADESSTSTDTKHYPSSVAKGNPDRLMNTGDNSKHSNGIDEGIIDNPPKLFEVINKHGLTVFLIVRHHFLS